MAKSAVLYLKDQLNFKVVEWQALTPEEKETLKRWAREEMDVLGIEHIIG